MLYVEYEDYKYKYYNAQKFYDAVLDEKENLFNNTQPKSTSLENERVSGGNPVNSFDSYLMKKEEKKIDERLAEAKSIVDDRKYLLDTKEAELRSSNNPYDKIYTYRYLDRFKVYKITRLVDYSEAQVYRFLRIIRKNLK